MGGPIDRGGPRGSRLDSRGEASGGAQQRWRPRQPQPLLADHGSRRRRQPSGALAAAIDESFGGLDALKSQLNDAGVKRFGSGWSWLVVDCGTLSVLSLPNQDSPLMEGKTPILGIDVWEHAYYLKYQNRRPDYLAAWWDVVNWAEVGRRFESAVA